MRIAQESEHPLLVVGVDDTDDLSKETSTGAIAQSIADAAVALGGSLRLGVTRHQLLLSEEVSYTSHNSSMVFEAFFPADKVNLLYEKAQVLIAELCAPTSNPGLCVAVLPAVQESPDFSRELDRLITFGEQAKIRYCAIKEAYQLAESISWLRLLSCGGDETGVVGALAGVGLRLGGNDGRFRGKDRLSSLLLAEDSCTVDSAVHALEAAVSGPVLVFDTDGSPLNLETTLYVRKEVKPVLRSSALTIICELKDGIAYPCANDDIKAMASTSAALGAVCDDFEWDNDSEECTDKIKSCRNCLYRRWQANDFSCIKMNQDADSYVGSKG